MMQNAFRTNHFDPLTWYPGYVAVHRSVVDYAEASRNGFERYGRSRTSNAPAHRCGDDICSTRRKGLRENNTAVSTGSGGYGRFYFPFITHHFEQSIRTLILLGVLVLSADVLAKEALAREGSISVAGWIERAVLFPAGLEVRAKLDTGARTSSVSAIDPVFFSRDGNRWVRFRLTSGQGQSAILEQPITRTATIKRHFGRRQARPVINLDICVGPIRKTVEVNLVDRSGLNYPLLIGRNFLAGDIVVDSGNTRILPPRCTIPEQ